MVRGRLHGGEPQGAPPHVHLLLPGGNHPQRPPLPRDHDRPQVQRQCGLQRPRVLGRVRWRVGGGRVLVLMCAPGGSTRRDAGGYSWTGTGRSQFRVLGLLLTYASTNSGYFSLLRTKSDGCASGCVSQSPRFWTPTSPCVDKIQRRCVRRSSTWRGVSPGWPCVSRAGERVPFYRAVWAIGVSGSARSSGRCAHRPVARVKDAPRQPTAAVTEGAGTVVSGG